MVNCAIFKMLVFVFSCNCGSLYFCVNFADVTTVQFSKETTMQTTSSENRILDIDELQANHQTVSVHKYGFFLCLAGTARILLGKSVYELSEGCLCIYTPNTFFHILERSSDLHGILGEYGVDTFFPIVGGIDIKKRLQIRHEPCVMIGREQAGRIVQLIEVMNGEDSEQCAQYLRYAVCVKILEAYFANKPMPAMEQDRNDKIVNRFLVSLYGNCRVERTVQFYADQQHLSPYYFSSIVKEKSGMSVMQWIENVTMTFARQYLNDSDMSLKQVACLLHFPDQSTFGRYFKQREGCSPSEYRNRKYK